jgi:hypothetical protein
MFLLAMKWASKGPAEAHSDLEGVPAWGSGQLKVDAIKIEITLSHI